MSTNSEPPHPYTPMFLHSSPLGSVTPEPLQTPVSTVASDSSSANLGIVNDPNDPITATSSHNQQEGSMLPSRSIISLQTSKSDQILLTPQKGANTNTVKMIDSHTEFATPRNASTSNLASMQTNSNYTRNSNSNSRSNSGSATPNLSDSTRLNRRNNNKKRTQSVDLSHLYLLNTSQDAQLTSTNESVADMSHKMITQYLGNSNNVNLVPRLKTIEMYKQNVKKSKDPVILFEFAQYLLQTALTMNETTLIDTEKMMKIQLLRESKHYLKRLSVKGYVDAQYLLADAYSSGVFGKIDSKEAFQLFQAAAKHGHIESAYRTAYCLEEGIGTTRDSRKSLNFLKFAASRNHPSAMYKLGLYSFYGKMGLPNTVNVKQNGIKWLSRAAARANELTNAAPYELAKIYEVGFLDIIIPDEQYAMELYIQAATLGHVPSCTLLGQIYETGNNTVKQDANLSIHYYTQAALKDDPVAMLGLCAWYLVGAEPAIQMDQNESFEWAQRAATMGYPKAQFTLGFFYEHGKGCEKNMTYALKWYERAAAKKEERAINKLQKLKGDTSGNSSRPYSTRQRKSSRKTLSLSTLNLFATADEGEDDDSEASNRKLNKDPKIREPSYNIESALQINKKPSPSDPTKEIQNENSASQNENSASQNESKDETDSITNNNTNVDHIQNQATKSLNVQSKNSEVPGQATVANLNNDNFKFSSSTEPPLLLQKDNKPNKGNNKQKEVKKKNKKKDCIIM